MKRTFEQCEDARKSVWHGIGMPARRNGNGRRIGVTRKVLRRTRKGGRAAERKRGGGEEHPKVNRKSDQSCRRMRYPGVCKFKLVPKETECCLADEGKLYEHLRPGYITVLLLLLHL